MNNLLQKSLYLILLVSACLPAVVCGEETPASKKPAYVVYYEQGKLEDARKELDSTYIGKLGEDSYKIWLCLIDLEKAAIMKEEGVKGYENIAFDNYLVLKALLGRNSDNPYYWLATAKSFYLNNSFRARDAIQKATYYKKPFPEASFIQLQMNKSSMPNNVLYSALHALIEMEGTPPFISAASYLQIASLDLSEYKNKINPKGIYSQAEKDGFSVKYSNIKENAKSNLERAMWIAPDSAYGKIAEKRLRYFELIN